jgi:hypothetical protein
MMRAAVLAMSLMACASTPAPIAHRAAAPAPEVAPGNTFVARSLRLGGHTHRTTWKLTLDGQRVTLASTTQVHEEDATLERLDREAVPWTVAEDTVYRGTIEPLTADSGFFRPGRLKMYVEDGSGSITMFCLWQPLDVAPAGAHPTMPPCGADEPRATERVRALVCEDIATVDSGSDDGRWVFGAPAVEEVEQHESCSGRALLRIARTDPAAPK